MRKPSFLIALLTVVLLAGCSTHTAKAEPTVVDQGTNPDGYIVYSEGTRITKVVAPDGEIIVGDEDSSIEQSNLDEFTESNGAVSTTAHLKNLTLETPDGTFTGIGLLEVSMPLDNIEQLVTAYNSLEQGSKSSTAMSDISLGGALSAVLAQEASIEEASLTFVTDDAATDSGCHIYENVTAKDAEPLLEEVETTALPELGLTFSLETEGYISTGGYLWDGGSFGADPDDHDAVCESAG